MNFRFPLLDFGRQRRTGADEAHLTAQHIPELWKLVDRGRAQNTTDPGDTRILANLEEWAVGFVLVGQIRLNRLGIDDHGAQLEDAEDVAVQTDAVLLEQNGSG